MFINPIFVVGDPFQKKKQKKIQKKKFPEENIGTTLWSFAYLGPNIKSLGHWDFGTIQLASPTYYVW